MITREVRPAESVSEAVVRTVSAVEDRHPRALPSLYGVVNPEALNDLFRRDSEREASRSDLVSFRFSESLVTVVHTWTDTQSVDVRCSNNSAHKPYHCSRPVGREVILDSDRRRKTKVFAVGLPTLGQMNPDAVRRWVS